MSFVLIIKRDYALQHFWLLKSKDMKKKYENILGNATKMNKFANTKGNKNALFTTN